MWLMTTVSRSLMPIRFMAAATAPSAPSGPPSTSTSAGPDLMRIASPWPTFTKTMRVSEETRGAAPLVFDGEGVGDEATVAVGEPFGTPLPALSLGAGEAPQPPATRASDSRWAVMTRTSVHLLEAAMSPLLAPAMLGASPGDRCSRGGASRGQPLHPIGSRVTTAMGRESSAPRRIGRLNLRGEMPPGLRGAAPASRG